MIHKLNAASAAMLSGTRFHALLRGSISASSSRKSCDPYRFGAAMTDGDFRKIVRLRASERTNGEDAAMWRWYACMMHASAAGIEVPVREMDYRD